MKSIHGHSWQQQLLKIKPAIQTYSQIKPALHVDFHITETDNGRNIKCYKTHV